MSCQPCVYLKLRLNTEQRPNFRIPLSYASWISRCSHSCGRHEGLILLMSLCLGGKISSPPRDSTNNPSERSPRRRCHRATHFLPLKRSLFGLERHPSSPRAQKTALKKLKGHSMRLSRLFLLCIISHVSGICSWSATGACFLRLPSLNM